MKWFSAELALIFPTGRAHSVNVNENHVLHLRVENQHCFVRSPLMNWFSAELALMFPTGAHIVNVNETHVFLFFYFRFENQHLFV